MSASRLRVVIGEDSVLLREGLASVLASRGFEVVAQAGDGEELVRKVQGHRPDVAIADIRMPPTSTDEGLRAAERIASLSPETGVLVLSDHLDTGYAMRLLEAGTPGRGYMLKKTVTELELLSESLRRVAAGESVVDPAIVRVLVTHLRTEDPLSELTPREREILELMAQGRSNKAVAAQLFLSERTVETHVRAIFRKLALEDTPDDHRRVLAVLTFLRER